MGSIDDLAEAAPSLSREQPDGISPTSSARSCKQAVGGVPTSRIASLDGLRGVAIILVLLFHGNVPGFRNGWIGVDIFFVLSGFLITSILVAEFERDGSICFREFYKRRSLRLAPALFLLSALFLIYAMIMLPHLPARLRETKEALLYASNWAQAFRFKDARYLGHTWSLGVEEDFYLLWPAILLLLFALFRHLPRWIIPICIAGLVLIAVAWRAELIFAGVRPPRVYNGFDTRCDSVFIGCGLAFLHRGIGVAWPLGLVGVLGFLSFGQWNSHPMLLWGYTVLALSSAALIAGACQPNSVCNRMLSYAPLVAIGEISYGLYLYHYPIYELITEKTGRNPWYLNTVGLLLTVCLALLSYKFVERPCLAIRHQSLRAPLNWCLALLGPVSVFLGAVYIARHLY